MVPLFVCSRIKYNFETNILKGCYPLTNASTFNGIIIEDVLCTLHEKGFDDMAASLFEYEYVSPLSRVHFIVHHEARCY
jgi:hypothetical protein